MDKDGAAKSKIKNVNFMESINNIVKYKENIVEELIALIKMTDDFYEGNQIALVLVDHFKDTRIEACLIDLINSPKWNMHNGTLLYALGEYTNDSKYLYFLIDLILNNEKDNNGEVLMGAYSMIINLHPPLDRKEITKSIQRVKEEENKKNISNEQRKIVNSLLNYLEGQIKITSFYEQFKM
jgi:hypothetical protein